MYTKDKRTKESCKDCRKDKKKCFGGENGHCEDQPELENPNGDISYSQNILEESSTDDNFPCSPNGLDCYLENSINSSYKVSQPYGCYPINDFYEFENPINSSYNTSPEYYPINSFYNTSLECYPINSSYNTSPECYPNNDSYGFDGLGNLNNSSSSSSQLSAYYNFGDLTNNPHSTSQRDVPQDIEHMNTAVLIEECLKEGHLKNLLMTLKSQSSKLEEEPIDLESFPMDQLF
ncbi:9525_t:CDS:2, partial [Cetraspora pellucida]